MKNREELVLEDNRRLKDLAGVGPATIEDLALLGVRSVPELAESDGGELYERLCDLTRARQDPCCLDIFRCAIAQARDPNLPEEQRNWWYWSQARKRRESLRQSYGVRSKHQSKYRL
jgi:nucleotidyltransferase/DNA polymerase involved in DNA repair